MKNKRTIKKMMSVFLAVAMVVSAVGTMGVTGFAVSDYTYTVTGSNAVKITSYGGEAENVAIPSEIDGYRVTAIGASAFANKSVRSVTVPSSVTTVELKAFLDCKNLETVSFENGTLTIGNCAFYGCTNLTFVQLPETLRSIGVCAFSVCRVLTSVYIPSSVTSISANAFENSAVTEIIGHEGTYAETFANSNGFTFTEYSMSFPNTVYSTVNSAEAGEEVVIPVKISKNTGLAGFGIKFNYDESVLTPVRIEESAEISLNGFLNDDIETSKVPGEFNVIWSGSDNMYDNGILFYAVFSVNGDAQGSTEIEVSFDGNNTMDEELDSVSLNCKNITLEISSVYDGLADVVLYGENAVAGDEVTINATLSNQTGTASYSFDISYDSDNFDFVNVSTSLRAALGSVSANGGHICFTLTSVPQSANNKTLFTVKLKSKDNANSGKYVFSGVSPTAHIRSAEIRISASATSETVKVYSADAVKSDSDSLVTVPVYFENNKGLMGYKLKITYDETLLNPLEVTRVGSTKGNFGDNIGLHEGYFDILWNGSENEEMNGEVMYITFEVISSETAVSKIGISYSQDDTFNEEYGDVIFDCKGTEVAINPIVGDVDFNGVVNPADYAELRSYVFCESALTPAQKLVSDFDDDGSVDGLDAVYLDLIINHAV